MRWGERSKVLPRSNGRQVSGGAESTKSERRNSVGGMRSGYRKNVVGERSLQERSGAESLGECSGRRRLRYTRMDTFAWPVLVMERPSDPSGNQRHMRD